MDGWIISRERELFFGMETIYSRLVAGPLRISTASINLVFVILLNID